jgi:hypothetical protein
VDESTRTRDLDLTIEIFTQKAIKCGADPAELTIECIYTNQILQQFLQQCDVLYTFFDTRLQECGLI